MDNICIMMYIESLGTLFGIWEAFGNFLLGNFIFGKFGRNFFVTLSLTSVRFLQMMAGNGTVLKALGFTNCQSVIHHFSIRYSSFFDVFVLAPFVTWLPRRPAQLAARWAIYERRVCKWQLGLQLWKLMVGKKL